MSEKLDLGKIKKYLEDYAKARDWEQFHNPKNIAMALSVEASELVELFQWLTPEQALAIKNDPAKLNHVSDELADILSYTILMSKYLGINLEEALDNKLEKNAEKYPVDKARGTAKKYTEL
ncbi:MAG: nucleotide pyrophosphohydrolase [Bacteriovoracaceae bacterium]|nr:nucleotide pyrophosphohydrolase [Bacteriovoracaceae bacterium]